MQIRLKDHERQELNRIGRQLVLMSNETKAKDIESKIDVINKEWQKIDEKCAKK